VGDQGAIDERIRLVPYDDAYGAVGGGGFEDMRRRVPDISKIQRYVGWAPRLSLDETLMSVIEYVARSGDRGADAGP
jgi:UDP-glucose 4-epimerase